MRNASLLTVLMLLLSTVFVDAQNAKRDYSGTALDGINFADYTTYSWLPFIDSVKTDEFDSRKLDNWITEAVDAQMAARGFTRQEDGGELILQYMLVLEESIGTKTVPVMGRPNISLGFGFGTGGVAGGVSASSTIQKQTVHVKYKEGALILGILDTELETTVWRGTISSIREADGQLVNPKSVIAEVVPKLYKEFPKVKRKKKK